MVEVIKVRRVGRIEYAETVAEENTMQTTRTGLRITATVGFFIGAIVILLWALLLSISRAENPNFHLTYFPTAVVGFVIAVWWTRCGKKFSSKGIPFHIAIATIGLLSLPIYFVVGGLVHHAWYLGEMPRFSGESTIESSHNVQAGKTLFKDDELQLLTGRHGAVIHAGSPDRWHTRHNDNIHSIIYFLAEQQGIPRQSVDIQFPWGHVYYDLRYNDLSEDALEKVLTALDLEATRENGKLVVRRRSKTANTTQHRKTGRSRC